MGGKRIAKNPWFDGEASFFSIVAWPKAKWGKSERMDAIMGELR